MIRSRLVASLMGRLSSLALTKRQRRTRARRAARREVGEAENVVATRKRHCDVRE